VQVRAAKLNRTVIKYTCEKLLKWCNLPILRHQRVMTVGYKLVSELYDSCLSIA
jgi:hypothetical protein